MCKSRHISFIYHVVISKYIEGRNCYNLWMKKAMRVELGKALRDACTLLEAGPDDVIVV